MSLRSGLILSLALLTLGAGVAEAQRGTTRQRSRGWVMIHPGARINARMLARQAEVRARMRTVEGMARARARAFARLSVRSLIVRRYYRTI